MANRTQSRVVGAVALLASTALLAGCPLDKPRIEDRWTRIDLVGSSVAASQPIAPGSSQPISLSASITYRSILTGFAVAELRASGSLSPTSVTIQPDANRVQMTSDIERVLASSVSVGRATRAVTGWDHLVQRIDFNFTGAVPATLDSTGAPAGLFLLCYLGSGEEIERADGSDTLIVTPFDNTAVQLLPVGMELAVAPPGP